MSRIPHAVIIGAGFGGLAAAVRLGARGYRCTIVDRLDQPGGRARVFRKDGFVFDAGPTVITAPFLFEELWQLCGRTLSDDVDLSAVHPFYRIRYDDGSTFDYSGDAQAMRTQIAQFSPSDVEGYDAFVSHSERIFKVGFERLAHVPFLRVQDMARIVPDMIRLENHRTVSGLVQKYIKNEKVRQALSFHPLLVGGNPFSTTSIYTLIAYLERKWGVHFAMGGTKALVDGLVKLIESQQGTLRLEEEVTRICLQGNRATGVQLASGETLTADIVVSNADSVWTYKHLVDPSVRRHWTDRRLERLSSSMSLFVWYFGTDRRYEDVAHHTILLGPRFEELLRDIFQRKVLADDFSLYLHRPTATDPSLAPADHDSFYVLSPVPHLESGTDWNTQAEAYRTRIERYLEQSLLPNLSKHLKASVVLTPQGFQDDYLSFRGAAFGVEPLLTQSAYFRPHNASEDVDRLYLVGAGTHPGAGVPGVLSAARVLDRVVPDVDQLDTEASDLATCESLLRFGSRSFYLASRLLPPKVRKAAIATYAFCRQADDAIDEGQDLDSIRKRIADVYGEAHSELPTDQAPAHPADRALRKVVREHAIPKEVFDLMLQGFHWDLEGRPYESLDDLLEYCVRVASTVGVLMSTVMGRRDTEALFRACDLGVAMQLTNIARDVGEDAQSGRLYLPRDWLRSEGIDADRWLENPAFKPEIARVVARLLREADRYFASAEPGIHLLPWESRVAIQAASVAYADIGNQIRKKGFDSVNHRAYTSSRRKLWLLLKSGSKVVMPKKADSEPRLKQAEALVQTMAA